MSDEEIQKLSERIGQELNDIERSLSRAGEGWERARQSNDDYYLDSVALNLHSVYNGFERIFIRPAVISAQNGEILDELRRFRHLVRNVYTHHLDPIRLGKLV